VGWAVAEGSARTETRALGEAVVGGGRTGFGCPVGCLCFVGGEEARVGFLYEVSILCCELLSVVTYVEAHWSGWRLLACLRRAV